MTRLPPGDVRHATGIAVMPDGFALVVMTTVVCAFIAIAALAARQASLPGDAGLSACLGPCRDSRDAALTTRSAGPSSATILTGPDGWASSLHDRASSASALSGPPKAVKPKAAVKATAAKPSSAASPVKKRWHRLISGVATWHATGRDGAYAAAGPLLREALGGGWRGMRVQVCSERRCIQVTLNDVCWCPKGRRLVDLSDEAFARLAPLSRGVITVDIRR